MDSEDFFFLLNSPYRRQILHMLENGSMTAGEITEKLAISQPSVSRHLCLLRQAGFIDSWRTGNQIHFELSYLVEQEIIRHMSKVFPKEMDRIKT